MGELYTTSHITTHKNCHTAVTVGKVPLNRYTCVMDFKVPEGYENFVTNKDDLLKQFKGNLASDKVCFSIYGKESSSLIELIDLRKNILYFVERCSAGFLWHKDGFDIDLVVDTKNETHQLFGAIEYGENVDDEWYVVYILLLVSKEWNTINISMSDTSDGQFLMIEAADYLDDWIGPDNTDNRVWIRDGNVHIIPFDEPGRRRDGGMELRAALRFMDSDARCTAVANSGVQKSIASRTTDVYPTRIQALDHSVACVMPTWAAVMFARYPYLVAGAVGAFCAKEQFTAKKNFSSSGPFESRDNSALSVIVIRFTRVLYAQLTFKQNFKPPRQYHGLMRRSTAAGSIKVQKAFNVGVRLACGLEAMYQTSASMAVNATAGSSERHDLVWQSVMSVAQKLPPCDLLSAQLKALHASNHLKVKRDAAEDEVSGEEEVAEQQLRLETYFRLPALHATIAATLVHEGIDAVCASLAADLRSADVDGVSTLYPSQSGGDCDEGGNTRAEERAFFAPIVNGTLPCDSDDWLYMSPEEMEKEMNSRMQKFGNSSGDSSFGGSSGGTTAGVSTAPVSIKKTGSTAAQSKLEVAPVSLSSTTSDTAASKGGAVPEQDMQGLIDGIKSFMKGKSEFDGVAVTQSDKSDKSRKSSKSKKPKDKSSGGNLSSNGADLMGVGSAEGKQEQQDLALDMDYLQRLLASHSVSAPSHDTGGETRGAAVSEGPLGMADIDANYEAELRDLQSYFSNEDLEAFDSDSDSNDSGSDSDNSEHEGHNKGNQGNTGSKSHVFNRVDTTTTPTATASGAAAQLAPGSAVVGVGSAILSPSLKRSVPAQVSSADSEAGNAEDSDDEVPASWDDVQGSDSDDEGEESDSDDEGEGQGDADATDFMQQYQNMMDQQLFGDAASTMSQTFERVPANSKKTKAGDSDSLGDVDIDLNLLKNLLESHSQSLGMPLNPASAMLSQLGLALPTPPPMSTTRKVNSEPEI